MKRQAQRDGFTLIEVMVALAILGIVVAQALAIFGAQKRTYARTERAIQVQQDVRLVADAILADMRMAGYMVPRQAGITSVDGGAAGSDVLCLSDPEKIADSEADTAAMRFEKAELSIAMLGATDSATLDPSDLDIDGDGNDDFTDGEGLIIVDDDSSHCGRITGITGGSNNVFAFVPDTPGGFNASTSLTRVVPAVVYWLNGTDLMRNGLRVATDIEDLQIEYGLDDNGDGLLAEAEYEDDLNGEDPLDLLAVRLSIIARADMEDDTLKGPGRPAAANRLAGANDGFLRRRVTTVVMPRNLK